MMEVSTSWEFAVVKSELFFFFLKDQLLNIYYHFTG